jgi:hypothetical protein
MDVVAMERGRRDWYEMFLHTVLLHDTEELDDDLGARSDQALSLSCLLGIVDRL